MNSIVSAFLKQVWLVLLLAIVLSGSLALVDASLQPRIEANQQDRLQRAVFEVVAEGQFSQKEEDLSEFGTVYRVLGKQQRLVGWAVEAETMGFADKIRMIIGLSADGRTITGLSILDSRETPGLGDEIKSEEWRQKFVGQPANSALEVVKPGQTADYPIDAITGATISAKAVTQGINQQLAQVREALANLPTSP
jgi:electron transport complex protein RnfG